MILGNDSFLVFPARRRVLERLLNRQRQRPTISAKIQLCQIGKILYLGRKDGQLVVTNVQKTQFVQFEEPLNMVDFPKAKNDYLWNSTNVVHGEDELLESLVATDVIGHIGQVVLSPV